MTHPFRSHLSIYALFSFLLLLTQTFFGTSVANAAWEPVAGATIEQSDRIYLRGTGYYTDNSISVAVGTQLSENLRLVIPSSTFSITNADGATESGASYFNVASVDDVIRIVFAPKRGTFSYSTELQQWVEDQVVDTDGDGLPDDTDQCPLDPNNDIDGDGICGDVDVCPSDAANDQDGDGICESLDQCPLDADNDIDGDGICGDVDVCPADPTDSCNIPSVTIRGHVAGGGAALANAVVRIGTSETSVLTDLAGTFEMDNVEAASLASDGVDEFYPVRVTADGFASGYAKVVAETGVTEYEVTLELRAISDQITADDELANGVDINDGGNTVGSLTIPDASLPDGVTEVTGTITYLDPNSDDILSAPGADLLALPAGADPNTEAPVILETFGMMEFNLVDQDGNDIHQLNGEAEVCMNATNGLVEGDTVPLWHYDEDQGLWLEEGQGEVVNRDGQLMICGNVTHFTWWNYDRPISTHACFHFSVTLTEQLAALDDLEWYAEGATYSGSSPNRSCDGSNGEFNSLTVKMTTDVNNPEQIRVYTYVGTTRFYLTRVSGNTYSLSSNDAEATVFNTPNVNGSCVRGSQTGNCLPLDAQFGGSGALLLDTNINFPPVISEFYLEDSALLIGASSPVQATVTDPEGTDVTLDWSIACGYYGQVDSGAVTPTSQNGSSGQQYNATVTAPVNLTNPLSYCEVTLTATDSDNNSSEASVGLFVAVNFNFQFRGTLYGTDGLPMPNTLIDYSNGDCTGFDRSIVTDTNGRYVLDLNFANCELEDYRFINIGEITVQYQFNGRSWENRTEFYEFSADIDICEVTENGGVECQYDVHLPVLWAPVTGTLDLPAGSAITNTFLVNYDYWTYEGYSFNQLLDSENIQVNGNEIEPLMLPLGINYMYFTYQNGGLPAFLGSTVEVRSLDGVQLALGTGTTPVSVTLFDDIGNPVAGQLIEFNSAQGINQGTTDQNGQVVFNAPVNHFTVRSQNTTPSYFYSHFVTSLDEPVVIDLNGNEQCMVTGTVYDVFGQPLPNYQFRYWDRSFLQLIDVTSDAQGQFNFSSAPGMIYPQTADGSYSGEIRMPNCRSVNGNPQQVRFDFVGN